jgi:glycine betaine catabolism B
LRERFVTPQIHLNDLCLKLHMKLTVKEIIVESSQTKTVRFIPEEKFNFQPGQFIMLSGLCGGKTVKRAYSIRSSPTKSYIDISVKLTPNPIFSKMLHSLKEGDILEGRGPFGHFAFQDDMSHVVLIGAGSGIAPLLSIADYIHDSNLQTKIEFIYSAKTAELVIAKDRLTELRDLPRTSVAVTLTQEEGADFAGRISKDILSTVCDDFDKPIFFVCGPPDMVNATAGLLLDFSVPKARIKTERFN